MQVNPCHVDPSEPQSCDTIHRAPFHFLVSASSKFLSYSSSMSPLPRSTVFYGLVINSQTLSSYQALPDCLLCVSPSGDIDWIEEDIAASMVQEAMAQKGSLDADLVELKRGEFIMPGFVDTHTVRSLRIRKNVRPLKFDA